MFLCMLIVLDCIVDFTVPSLLLGKMLCKVHHSAGASEHCLAFVEALSLGYLQEEKDTFLHSHTEQYMRNGIMNWETQGFSI